MRATAYLFMFSMLAGCVGADGEAVSGEEEGAEELSDNLVSSVTNGDFVIRSVRSGKCIDVASSSTANGAKVQQWDCNGTKAQLFSLRSVGGDVYQIVNANSGKLLDIRDVSVNAGAALQQWDDANGANQKFQIANLGGTQFSIRAQHSGQFLDVSGGSTNSGAAIVQWSWNNGTNQRWTFDKVGGGSSGGSVAEACTPTIQFENRDAAGKGRIFDQQVPNPTTFAQGATQKVCSILYHASSEVPRVPTLRLIVEDMDGVAYAAGGEVHLSSRYLQDVANGGRDVAAEIRGVIHHEFTHVYQYNDGPGWLVEGLADYVRYKSGNIPLSNRHRGGKYDDAYQTTGFFIAWLDERFPDFGYKLNQTLTRNDGAGWSTRAFQDLTGKDVDTLWREYQSSI